MKWRRDASVLVGKKQVKHARITKHSLRIIWVRKQGISSKSKLRKSLIPDDSRLLSNWRVKRKQNVEKVHETALKTTLNF